MIYSDFSDIIEYMPETVGQYLPPDEQLIIAAKVHRLYEINRDQFDPATHVADAKDVVRALAPRIKKTGAYLKVDLKGEGRSSRLLGSTGQGNISVGLGGEDTKFTLGQIDEYRIGGYVATKDRMLAVGMRGAVIRPRLIFQPFWDRDKGWKYGRFPEELAIEFKAADLSPQRIYHRQPNPVVLLGTIIYFWESLSYKEDLLWSPRGEQPRRFILGLL